MQVLYWRDVSGIQALLQVCPTLSDTGVLSTNYSAVLAQTFVCVLASCHADGYIQAVSCCSGCCTVLESAAAVCACPRVGATGAGCWIYYARGSHHGARHFVPVHTGSANSNFFYAMTLVWAGAQVFVMLLVTFAVKQHDVDLSKQAQLFRLPGCNKG